MLRERSDKSACESERQVTVTPRSGGGPLTLSFSAARRAVSHCDLISSATDDPAGAEGNSDLSSYDGRTLERTLSDHAPNREYGFAWRLRSR